MTDLQGVARTEAIADYGVIGTGRDTGGGFDEDLQGLVEIAAQVCGVPQAAINLIDHREQHQVATVGLEPSVCSTEDSMCATILSSPGPVHVRDAREDSRFASNPFVTGAIARVRFYAASQLRTPAGVVIGTLCVFDEEPRELTAQQRRSLDILARQVVDVLELLRTSRELRRSNDELAHFAGQVSHDLLNPLTALTGFLEVVGEQPAVTQDPVAGPYLGRAAQSADRMRLLVDDLLDYARLGGRLRLERVDLAAVCADVLEDLSARVARTGATVEVDALPTVTADRVQVQAVLQNLVANALKFRRDDQPARIRVGAVRVASGWRVAVDDAGPGVPEHLREKVFGLLERGSAVAEEGAGIGLSTCRRIIDAHGGRIGLDASTDGGTSAWFVLPDRD
ncbi:GAF domain-containing protein [Pedococcus cremeus]|uniref:histidine kinase n=1 Tax=Pedococcus cremeus TaxID=587636 RepID=A0A1H9VSG7_9MICO|nr:ATP-binding protein [Pedococcus cremeus]SES24444.1 GAF domain-containing protein [Pedococcus cremeus]